MPKRIGWSRIQILKGPNVRIGLDVSRYAAAWVISTAAIVAFAWATPPARGDDGCANESRRSQQSATYLPDCRAYELVTPSEKDSGEPNAVESDFGEASLIGEIGAHAATDGDRMAWDSEYTLPGSESTGVDYLSTRREGGWTSENVIPRQSVETGVLCDHVIGMVAWSADLSAGVLADGFGQSSDEPGTPGFTGEGLGCGHDEPRLVAGEPEGFQNLFVRHSEAKAYELVNVTPMGIHPELPVSLNELVQFFPAAFLAGSDDLSHVVFEEELPLTENAPSGDDLYAWSEGTVHLVSILPGGTAVVGTLASATRNAAKIEATNEFGKPNIANDRHAVSANGENVFFEAGGSLYLRENVDQPLHDEECAKPSRACTLQLDASQGGAGENGGGKFMAASENDARAFFLDESQLTPTSTAESGKPDLYEYDLERPSGERLKDITADVDEPSDVLGVSGAGEDGSDVYFVADGVLAQGATAGSPNLYVYAAGAVRFVATLNSSSDSCDWTTNTGCPGATGWTGLTARVSANGAFIAFPSTERLTGFDNADTHTGEPDSEIFLYEAASNEVQCASCAPNGSRPTAPAIIRYPARPDNFANQMTAYPQRNVSNNGQVFFESADELLDAATDGKRNVYEYSGGTLSLISSGESAADSYFLDASVSGSDVFFATAQRLVANDQDDVYDIYDARVNGGFLELGSGSTECVSSQGCEGPAGSAPVFSAPGSNTYVGSGNLRQPGSVSSHRKATVKCKRGYMRKRKRCVRKRRSSASKSGRGRK
jgi:hypothetical protein